MASSQVEISSSAPFGCVLRDHNQRDICRDSHGHAAFQKKLHSLTQMNNIDHWVCTQEKTTLQSFRFNGGHPIHSSTTSPIKSRLLEHLAAKQSQMATDPSTSRKDESLPRSAMASEISNLGASSLVQLWEKRLNRSNHSIININSSISESSYTESTSSADERFDPSPTPANIPPSTSHESNSDMNSDAGEKERVRVADIIRRLTAAKQTQSPISPWGEENDPLNDRDQAENRFYSQIISSPRIRGRQAFTDLLMQMERDRHSELDALVERRAVSKFSHRGRIQSSLRIRILQRGMEVAGLRQQLVRSMAAEDNRCQEASTSQIRARFSASHESDEAANPRNPSGERVENSMHVDNCSTSYQIEQIDLCNQQIEFINDQIAPDTCNDSTSSNVQKNLEEEEEEIGQSSHQLWHHKNIEENHNLDLVDMENSISSSMEDWDEISEEEDNDEESNRPDSATNYDWFSDISRPRSYWEDRRKKWYQEVLTTSSDNQDIRQLLERKTVSNFLVSEFRERIDQLMVYRLERQTGHEEEHHEESHGRLEHILQEERIEEEEEEEEGDNENEEGEEEEEEEGEEESLVSGQYHEVSDYFDQSTSSLQLPSPTMLRAWSFRDNEVGNDSVLPPTLPSQASSYQEDSRQSSPSINNHHPSLEMEVMYNLGKQMEKLYEEMSELRKSIKSCMDMQLTLQQQSMKHQVLTNKSFQDITIKRHCCICYEMQVDSLLYRCGHMCTCLKCAHELQWSSGKCPICRAPIVDVVRAYTDS